MDFWFLLDWELEVDFFRVGVGTAGEESEGFEEPAMSWMSLSTACGSIAQDAKYRIPIFDGISELGEGSGRETCL